MDIRHAPALTIHERAILLSAALIVQKLEQAHPCQVAFVSSAQYYVTYSDIGEALRQFGNMGIQSATAG